MGDPGQPGLTGAARPVADQDGWACAVLDALPDAVLVADGDGLVQGANPAVAELLGWPRSAVVGRPLSVFLHTDVPICDSVFSARRAEEAEERSGLPLRGRALRADGADVAVDVSVRRARGSADEELTVVVVHPATNPETLVRTQEFLLQSARALAEAADYTDALDRLAEVAVPLLGDLCLIDVLREDGELARMSARHADPAKQPLVDELGSRYPPDPAGSHPAVDVIRTGRSHWSSDMPRAFLAKTTRDARHLELVQLLGFTSYMAVPLRSGETILGSLTLVSAGSGRRFSHEDLALAQELAAHAAAVIDRARSLDREKQAAHELQSALLPATLPDLAGFEVAARYVPGAETAEVGGDWYDVIPLPDGRVALAIGDVAGHDIGAAAVMGQLRNVTLAYALRDGQPAAVVAELRRFCELAPVERMATVAYCRLDPSSGTLTALSAGHPAPLVRRADGSVETVAVDPSPPLGVAADEAAERDVVIGAGDTLLLFTDGLIERRDASVEARLEQLAGVVAALPAMAAAGVCEAVLDAMAPDGDRADDIAVLVIRRPG
ncbi:MAG TPA: SpoIIE family protein phosphatase [Acidimicrobiales bacterium]|nr:SpoIIE family protein phosphatase [Acidimicrobiales bacterium]